MLCGSDRLNIRVVRVGCGSVTTPVLFWDRKIVASVVWHREGFLYILQKLNLQRCRNEKRRMLPTGCTQRVKRILKDLLVIKKKQHTPL